jgi:hypothetical protein
MKTMKEIVVEIITGITIEQWEANNRILDEIMNHET